MEIFDLSDLLRKDNFRVLIVNGEVPLFEGGYAERLRGEDYNVSELNSSKFDGLSDLVLAIVGRKVNYIFLNYRDLWEALLLQQSISVRRKKADDAPAIGLANSINYEQFSSNLSLMMARRFWNHDFEGFVRRFKSKGPYVGFGHSVALVQEHLGRLFDNGSSMLGDDIWEKIVVVYGLAVGQGNHPELVARLEGVYKLIYGEDLRDSIYHSGDSSCLFSSN